MTASTKAMRPIRSQQSLIAEPAITEGLPDPVVSEWRLQQVLYDQYWQWMDGAVWDQVDQFYVKQKGKEPPLLFPIQVNPLYTAAIIHRNALFGEVSDTGGPMVKPIAIPKTTFTDDSVSEEARLNAKFVTALLEQLWYQSSGRASMLDAGYISQTLGGCVWKVSYEPNNPLLEAGLPVAFRNIEPEFFLPVYSRSDRWNLIEARIGRKIGKIEAKEIYGVTINEDEGVYLERWTRQRVEITIDGEEAIKRISLPGGRNAEIPFSAGHGYGFVPIVYIPHEIVGQFYGVPIVNQLGNLLKELNGRMADVGDAVRNSIDRMYILTNADSGDLKITDMGDGIKVMSTGREMSGTQGKRIDHVAPPDLPRGTMDFLKILQKATWHGMFTPAVAYGEDEGSQRSALTLAFRMWPLTSHIRAERSLWTEGLRLMGKMALKILLLKQAGDFGDMTEGTPWKVEKKHMDHKIVSNWAPMIPRDRESEQNLAILRHQDEQLSAKTSMRMMDDIPDVDREYDQIQEEKEDGLKLTEKYTPEPTAPGGKPKGAKSDKQEPIAKASVD